RTNVKATSKLTQDVHNEAKEPSNTNNRTDLDDICLENIRLILWDDHSYQKGNSRTSQPTCQSINADKARISDLVNICTNALRYEDDESMQKEEILSKIKGDMEDSLLFCLYLDGPIHAIYDICGNIQNEINEHCKCCVSHTNSTEVDHKTNELFFVSLCHAMKLFDELVNALCDKFVHGLIINLSNLSKQYNDEPRKQRNYINDVIFDILNFHRKFCRYLRKNSYGVLKRSRAILITSEADKQDHLNSTNVAQDPAHDNAINFEKPGSSSDTAESDKVSKLLDQLKKSLIRTKRVMDKEDDGLTNKLVSELDCVVSWIEESLKCGFHNMTDLTR
ncbi:hypothetical protein VCUG_02679, partial [Vavraia culicis subsp. floridensis]